MYVISNKPTTKEQIFRIEQKYALTFNEKYTNFLLKYNGCYIMPELGEGLIIPGLNINILVRYLFGIDVKNDMNMEYITDAMQNDLPKGALVIGKDSYNGYIVIIEEKIYFWDEKNALEFSSEENGNAYLLYDSFERFWEDLDANVIKIYNENKGENIMGKIDYLALGSVVCLNGGIQKIMVTSRGLQVNHGGNDLFFDYAGVLYPQGLTGDQIIYFNHDNIRETIFEGYRDADDSVIVGNINKFLEENPDIVRGNIDNWG